MATNTYTLSDIRTQVGPGMYRSVRATVPIQKNRYMYFEMTLNQPKSPYRIPSRHHTESSRGKAAGAAGGATKPGNSGEPSVCIGLSTRTMPLNTLVGASKYSVGIRIFHYDIFFACAFVGSLFCWTNDRCAIQIGFYSVGHVLIGSERRNFVSVDLGFGYEATVGVLVKVVDRDELLEQEGWLGAASGVSTDPATTKTASGMTYALVRFSVNGVALRDEAHRVMVFTLPFPPNSELFPTLTLHSQDVQVLSRFSAADITALNAEDFDLPATGENPEIWCLDGLKLGIPC